MVRFTPAVILMLLVELISSAQEITISETIASVAEELADDESDPDAVALFVEKLNELSENPVLINSGDENELSRLFFLTDFQIKSINDYVRSTGKVYSVYEIANIPGFDRELAGMIVPFISLKIRPGRDYDTTGIRSFLLTNICLRQPAAGNPGPGSNVKMLTRYRINSNGFTAGFTSEKDAGEKFLTGHPPSPDFLSAHLSWNGAGTISRIIIGDFSARFGLGTNLNTGPVTGLSLTASGYLSGRDEIKPYTSTDENRFFRGFAATLRLGDLSVSAYISHNRIDASPGSFNGLYYDHIESFYTSGLHNSRSSLLKKDAVAETGYGTDISLNLKKLRIGLLYTETRFSLPLISLSDDPLNLFDFTGSLNRTATFYYKYATGKIIVYGELSSCLNGKNAIVQGVSIKPDNRLILNILFRKYDPGYMAFHGKPPFSSSSAGNSEGVVAGFIFEAAKHVFISAGCDFRIHPWLKYRCSAPSISVNREIRIRYVPSETVSAEMLLSYRKSLTDINTVTGIEKQEDTESRSFRAVVRYSPVSRLTLTTRFDFRQVISSRSSGSLLYQDVCYRLGRIPLSLWFRYSVFRTDGWDSRIYAYENDLINSFSIPALSGEGSRSYIMIGLKALRATDIRIKYSFTETYTAEGTNDSHEFRMQVRCWF